jgi:hypothetical protein
VETGTEILAPQQLNGMTQEVAPQFASNSFMGIIAAAASGKADVAVIRELLAMAKDVQAMEARTAFNAAMKAAQEEIRPVVKDAENSHTRTRYALLETIDKRIRPIYTKHGFSLSFNSAPPAIPGSVRILCSVRHDVGHTEPYELEGALDVSGAKGSNNKTDIQGLGSTVSYLRRYLTCMIFNVVLTKEDNDGAATVQFISEDQVDNVASMLEECGLKRNDSGFLAWAGADRIEHIMPAGLPRVMRELEKRRAAR